VVDAIALSPSEQSLLTNGDRGKLVIWDIRADITRRLRTTLSDVNDVGLSSDGRLVAVGDSEQAEIYDLASGERLSGFSGYRRGGLVFSVDGRLAAESDEGLLIRDGRTGAELLRLTNDRSLGTTCFSPDGRRIAGESRNGLAVWDAQTGALLSECRQKEVYCVAFSPDGLWLASSSRGQTISIWNAHTGAEVRRFSFPEDYAYRLAWAPDGAFVVSANQSDVIRIWDTRQFAVSTSIVTGPPAERPLPPELIVLPPVMAALARLGIHPPASLVRSTLDLLAGIPPTEPLAGLAQHAAVRRLRSLPWRSRAVPALTALLFRDLQPAEPWIPPADLPPTKIASALAHAMSGDRCEPETPAPPIAQLAQTAATIDERVITLLSALGPEALAKDPGLALRLAQEADAMPVLSEAERRLLHVRLAGSDTGAAQSAGAGLDRAGIAPRGLVTALVPSQLAYPWSLVAFKHQTGGLLYRARSGRLAPRLRPTVLVLDVSPASFGPVESLTRLAAFMIASTLRRQNIAVALVAAGGETTTHRLEQPAEVLKVFTERRREPADVAGAMAAAGTLALELASADDGDPLVLLLAHTWWGAEVDRTARAIATASVRGLFVQPPGKALRPEWADVCERWESLRIDQHAELPAVLGRILA
jgi:ATP-dependent Clp protease ATP-binding subunit ClpC